MTRDTIKAGEKALVDVFCDKYLFRIPPYQRPYAWTTDEAGELLDDLMTALGDGQPSDQPPYFLGSIVLIKDPELPDADVVDGQQRLTTLTILLAVLRDLADDVEARNDIDAFIRQKGHKFKGVEDKYRVSLRERDADFFQEAIQSIGATAELPDPHDLSDSRANMVRNASHFVALLSDMPEQDRDRLMIYMIQRCFLVTVEASDAAAAYRIFAVMNDRGLDLSPTDILKAEIIGALPVSERVAYTDKWETIEEELRRDKFRDLFGHIRMISRKQKMRGTLEAEFRQYVPAVRNPKQFIDTILDPLATAYLEVINQDFQSAQYAEVINRHLVHLSRLDNFDWEAPAIAFIARHRKNPEAIRDFIVDLERLAYGLFILRANINERISRYGRLLSEIGEGADLKAEDSPLQLSRAEQIDLGEKLHGSIYLVTRVRLPLLLRLDEAVSDKLAIYDHRIITVEHVLPQRPGAESQWLEWFPDEEERAAWVHRLGNLVLLSRAKNSQASNFKFDKKKSEYFARKGTSTFALTSQVLAEGQWTPDVLERRQDELIKRLCNVWRLDIGPISLQEIA